MLDQTAKPTKFLALGFTMTGDKCKEEIKGFIEKFRGFQELYDFPELNSRMMEFLKRNSANLMEFVTEQEALNHFLPMKSHLNRCFIVTLKRAKSKNEITLEDIAVIKQWHNDSKYNWHFRAYPNSIDDPRRKMINLLQNIFGEGKFDFKSQSFFSSDEPKVIQDIKTYLAEFAKSNQSEIKMTTLFCQLENAANETKNRASLRKEITKEIISILLGINNYNESAEQENINKLNYLYEKLFPNRTIFNKDIQMQMEREKDYIMKL